MKVGTHFFPQHFNFTFEEINPLQKAPGTLLSSPPLCLLSFFPAHRSSNPHRILRVQRVHGNNPVFHLLQFPNHQYSLSTRKVSDSWNKHLLYVICSLKGKTLIFRLGTLIMCINPNLFFPLWRRILKVLCLQLWFLTPTFVFWFYPFSSWYGFPSIHSGWSLTKEYSKWLTSLTWFYILSNTFYSWSLKYSSSDPCIISDSPSRTASTSDSSH